MIETRRLATVLLRQAAEEFVRGLLSHSLVMPNPGFFVTARKQFYVRVTPDTLRRWLISPTFHATICTVFTIQRKTLKDLMGTLRELPHEDIAVVWQEAQKAIMS